MFFLRNSFKQNGQQRNRSPSVTASGRRKNGVWKWFGARNLVLRQCFNCLSELQDVGKRDLEKSFLKKGFLKEKRHRRKKERLFGETSQFVAEAMKLVIIDLERRESEFKTFLF
ncbi:hypothetical protein NPIL_112531 [Nephila pilipes]|uniref:Uncharacterized protein n=1 Tax=Nephila pilipes TaxID=299642 RepID=A0A8X6MWU9_NEPPI|nr:hypothetical protein NPIL_112531 [Nephila pilipes]